MPFFDAAAYSAHVREQNALASGLTVELAFDETGTHLAALTSAGKLVVHAVGGTAPATPYAATSLHTTARALAAGAAGLYVGSCDALLRLGWGHAPPRPILGDVGVVAIAAVPGNIVAAAVPGGWVAVVDEARGEPAALVGGDAGIECLAALPSESLVFIAGCDDGAVRQYDCRAGREAVRTVFLKGRRRLTIVATNDDGSFAMVGNVGYAVSTLHLPTESIVASAPTQFVPRALAFARGSFYCGGSDYIDAEVGRCLEILDFQCNSAGSTPVSASSVYALEVHPKSALMAAGGYSPEKCRAPNSTEIVDLYVDPPLRSFSLAV